MAITTLGTHIPTADEFIHHWGLVNAELGSEMALQGGYALADFTADRDELEAKFSAIVGATNTVQITSGVRDTSRSAIRERIRQFRAQVMTLLPDSPYANALPDLPQQGAGEEKMLAAIDDVESLWTQINADTTTPGFTAPLTIAGGYALAEFTTDGQAFRGAYKAWRDAEKSLDVERDRRDAMLEPLRSRMRQYQTGVEANLAAGHVLLESVPLMYPSSGSTPDAVTLSGEWDETLMEVSFSWTESTDANLSHYSLRMTPGDTYDTDNDVVIDTIASGTMIYNTSVGVASPGTTATYRLYVVLTTGNEKGSNDVVVARALE